MTIRPHALARAENTTHAWLHTVAQELGSDDPEFTFRAVRTWLHCVRDRLTVESAAHLAAQLPELLRGVFYDGWSPSRVPTKADAEETAERFAHEAMIPLGEVHNVAAAVSVAMRGQFSPGQLDTTFANLPIRLRALLEPDPDRTPGGDGRAAGRGEQGGGERVPSQRNRVDTAVNDRLADLERHLQALTEAVRALAVGMEEVPVDEPSSHRAARAARRAHQLLLAAGREV
ncbi:DUF2267 domain-containing protein [Actinopolymorpha rutila]|uniref:Uncharacterized protein (DUF2267 family) n=1 Tax=Actinopolymorpha rutila TaxID=446787 RepID=A0A852Z6J9_9ACTN|nr:DUF2267 domain-containing protein [Actinopolymorpha rutila]NYH88531.1 uncharacterized protein (DUF2267 family) [Actinopolymorpha rutila]